jgi:hypothetical protein
MSSEIKEINFVVGLPSSNNFVIRAISMPPKKQTKHHFIIVYNRRKIH